MPSALIFYQYFHPDDVVSATHLTDLAEGLVSRGWDVTALPCNRSCRTNFVKFPRSSIYAGIQINRIWRPDFQQSAAWGRLANCAWMIASWSLSALRHRPDIVIVGTDPILSATVAIPWKWLRRRTQAIHWCLDLYPEAAIADGLLQPGKTLALLKALMRAAYKRLDLIADLGSCMRTRLSEYQSPAKNTTLTPWALEEPPEPLDVDYEERNAMFGNARLALLYSGNFGRAHSYEPLLTIAREMSDTGAHFAFSIRGNCADQVRAAVNEQDRNISFVPFARPDRLQARLSAPDIHIVSLRPEWTGTVVPSKFFGALAAGRPVLFIGSEESFVARQIRQHGLGWVCSPGMERAVAAELRTLIAARERLLELRRHCHRVYAAQFSKTTCLDRFDRELRDLLRGPAKQLVEHLSPDLSLSQQRQTLN